MKANGMDEIVIHAPYIINLANTVKPETYELAVEFLEKEIDRTAAMGSKVLILHPRSQMCIRDSAHIVRPFVVILVALTALSAFTIPNELFASAFRMVKFYLIIAASLGGFVGLTAAVLTVMLHLSGLKSFGVPYMRCV